jgi:hypothetical protein
VGQARLHAIICDIIPSANVLLPLPAHGRRKSWFHRRAHLFERLCEVGIQRISAFCAWQQRQPNGDVCRYKLCIAMSKMLTDIAVSKSLIASGLIYTAVIGSLRRYNQLLRSRTTSIWWGPEFSPLFVTQWSAPSKSSSVTRDHFTRSLDHNERTRAMLWQVYTAYSPRPIMLGSTLISDDPIPCECTNMCLGRWKNCPELLKANRAL